MGEALTIVIQLPAPLGAVVAVVQVIAEHWPDATIDMGHPNGWRITLTPPTDP